MIIYYAPRHGCLYESGKANLDQNSQDNQNDSMAIGKIDHTEMIDEEHLAKTYTTNNPTITHSSKMS